MLVVCGNKVRNLCNFITNLIGTNKEVGVILCKLTNAEQAVKRTFKLVTVIKTCLCQFKRQITIRTRFVHIYQTSTRTVHRLNGKIFFVNFCGVHIFFVVIPVTRSFPQFTRKDNRCLNLLVTKFFLHFLPIVHECIADTHTIGQPKRKTRTCFVDHKQIHFATNLSVVTFFCFCHKAFMLNKLFFCYKCNTGYTGKHFVITISFPICTRNSRKLKSLCHLGVAHMRACAHINVFTLLIEGKTCVLRKIANMFYLKFLAALFKKSNRLVAWQFKSFNFEILF